MKSSRSTNSGPKSLRQGIDTKESDAKSATSQGPSSKKRKLPHLVYAVALPYYYGAKVQVLRYKEAAATLEDSPVSGVQTCIHEVSCLFEDLATVTKYAEMCGHNNDLHPLWLDVRNHIRHDIREEFDNESDGRKNARAKRLGLNPKLQISISFKPDEIIVGSTSIKTQSIEDYLDWAGEAIGGVLNEAQEKGWIK